MADFSISFNPFSWFSSKKTDVPMETSIVPSDADGLEQKSAVDAFHYNLLAPNGESGVREAYPDYQLEITKEMAARIYSQSPVVNTAIKIGANAVSQVPVRVLMSERSDSRAVTEKQTGYPFRILDFVNPHMVFSELMANTYSWYKLVGEAFWAILDTPEEYNTYSAISIYPLNPQYVKVVTDPDTSRRAYIYRKGKEVLWLDDREVIHFRNFNPHDHWQGHLDLNALSYDMQIERYGKKGMKNFQSNAAIISGIIKSKDTLGEDEIRRLKRQYHEQYGGARNAYRIVVLENDMDYEPVKNGGVFDQSFVEMMKAITENETAVLGVPIPLLTGRDAAGKLVEVEALMWKQNLLPFLRYVSQVLTKRMARPISSRLSIVFDTSGVDALMLHELDRVRTETAAVMVGLDSPNEIRQRRGRDAWPSEYDDFANAPKPYYDAQQAAKQKAAGVSPSLSLPGSEGGRDQSASGEAQMADTTGQRSAQNAVEEGVFKDILSFVKSGRRGLE